jgi:hypothetical protein
VQPNQAVLTAFNGQLAVSTLKGELHINVSDKNDPTKKFKLVVESWGVKGVGPSPLISMDALVKAGVVLCFAKGNSYVDFEKLGGPKLAIEDDGRVMMERVQPDSDGKDGWQTVGGSRRANRSTAGGTRYAPRQLGKAKND